MACWRCARPGHGQLACASAQKKKKETMWAATVTPGHRVSTASTTTARPPCKTGVPASRCHANKRTNAPTPRRYTHEAKALGLGSLLFEAILYMNMGDELGDFAGFKPGDGFVRKQPKVRSTCAQAAKGVHVRVRRNHRQL